MMRYKKRRRWADLDVLEKLGYAWVVIYLIMIFATAGAILVPAYKKWQTEHPDKQGRVIHASPERRLAAHWENLHHGTSPSHRGAVLARRLPLPTGLG